MRGGSTSVVVVSCSGRMVERFPRAFWKEMVKGWGSEGGGHRREPSYRPSPVGDGRDRSKRPRGGGGAEGRWGQGVGARWGLCVCDVGGQVGASGLRRRNPYGDQTLEGKKNGQSVSRGLGVDKERSSLSEWVRRRAET